MFPAPAIVIDFETKSRVDLKAAGTDRYVQDSSTDILCCCFIDVQTGEEWLWYPHEGPLSTWLYKRVEDADYVIAHHARFDQGIWEYIAVNDYDFPALPADKWYCSAAQCRVNALPAAMEKAARALDGKHRKDHRGTALIKLLSIPNAEGKFTNDPEALQEMGAYCLQDGRTTVELVNSTRPMTAQEYEDWLINERINDRGVRIDKTLAGLALQYAAAEQAEIAKELNKISGGVITKHTQHVRIAKWLYAHLNSEAQQLMVVYKKGERKISADKTVRANLLNAADSFELDMPDYVYDVLALVDDGSKSSVAKFKRMLNMADPDDDRVRGAFLYAGAGQIKRYSSKGLQLHNFRRECYSPKETSILKTDMRSNMPLDNVMNTLSKLLRPALIPEDGSVFVVGDWSAIEGRLGPWLSDDSRAQSILDMFERDEEDFYVYTGAQMGLTDRQICKVVALSLQFQGAVGAFSAMARNYGVYLPEPQIIRLVKQWRNANPWAVDYWAKLERAAIRAVQNPGEYFTAGRVKYVYTPDLLDGTLFCILPDSSAIQYSKAKLETVETPWGKKKAVTYLKASMSPAADATEWPRGTLYGGFQMENICQATAAVLLSAALRTCMRPGIKNSSVVPIVAHLHDELVLEVPLGGAKNTVQMVQHIMETRHSWALDLPLKAVPVIMTRYGK